MLDAMPRGRTIPALIHDAHTITATRRDVMVSPRIVADAPATNNAT